MRGNFCKWRKSKIKEFKISFKANLKCWQKIFYSYGGDLCYNLISFDAKKSYPILSVYSLGLFSWQWTWPYSTNGMEQLESLSLFYKLNSYSADSWSTSINWISRQRICLSKPWWLLAGKIFFMKLSRNATTK